MRQYRESSGERVAGLAARRVWGVSGALIVVLSSSSCIGEPTSPRVAPRLTPTPDVAPVTTTMAPVTKVPVRELVVPGPKAVFRWRHSYDGATLSMMLMLIDGVPLGLRPDSSVDQAAAELLLKQVRPTDIESITVLKGDEAVRRFGRAANPGVILITTRSHTRRTSAGHP